MTRWGILISAAAIGSAALLGACDDGSDDAATHSAGSGGSSSAAGGGNGGSGAIGSGGSGGSSTGCHGTPRPDNAARAVVVSHPYDTNADPATGYELLSLDGGVLSTTGTRFDMGRAIEGVVSFTPDGAVGMLAQEDGTLGVFTLDDDGAVTVVHAAFAGSFYATGVVIDSSGDFAYVLDVNFPNNGGGIYRVAIGCDGSLRDEGLVATSKLAQRMVPLGDGSLLLAADEVLQSPLGADAHWITLDDPAVNGSVDTFGDDAIVSSLAVTRDGRYGLIGDNSGFSVEPNSVAVVAITPSGVTAVQRLSPVEDPVGIVTSPFNDRAIVTSAFGDTIFELAYDPQNSSAPFAVVGQVNTTTTPQIPVDAVAVTRGDHDGHVLVAEVTRVRQLAFRANMPVAEVGSLDFGSGYQNIVGAIGLQP